MRLKYPKPHTAKTRLGSVVGMQTACDLAIAMFADLVERFQEHGSIPLVVAGSQDASAEDYRSLLRDQGVATTGIESIIAEAQDFRSRVLKVWELLLPRFERVVQCVLDIPHYTPRQYQRLSEQLSSYDVVFHPTMDDGMCPYGAKQPIDLWAGIDPLKPGALLSIVRRLRRRGLSWWCAEPIFDVDTVEDLRMLYRWMSCLSPQEESFCPRTLRLCKKIL